MKFYKILVFSAFALAVVLAAAPANAAGKVNVLIIDSGSDFTHAKLKPLARPNQAEFKGKPDYDDDDNGYADDIYGWNFVEGNRVLVNLDDTPPQYSEVLKCMELLGILQAYGKEGMSAEDFNYLVKKSKDKKFWAWLNFTGGWAHGTHCAGIVATKNDAVNFKAIRHIPTGNSPQCIKEIIAAIKHLMLHNPFKKKTKAISIDELGQYFEQMGKENALQTTAKAEYIRDLKPRLINCSFGVPNENIFNMMKANMPQWGFKNPTNEQVQEITNLFVEKAFLPRDKALFRYCKDALIFIAAGNSSENLDPFVSSPNDVKIENKIVIAATDHDQKIAPFSCYGVKTVDVAVPGVNIYATYPNNEMGYMSGTSMACPNALRMASLVLNENPSLTPIELKKILMGTVDKKDWLKDKVKSSGIINTKRAVYAAKLVKNGKSVSEAITEAREKVSDMVVKSVIKSRPNLKDPVVRKLYFSNIQ